MHWPYHTNTGNQPYEHKGNIEVWEHKHNLNEQLRLMTEITYLLSLSVFAHPLSTFKVNSYCLWDIATNLRQIALVTMESIIYWTYSWSHFRTAGIFQLKEFAFCELQLETQQFIRETKFSSPVPAGSCETQSFCTLCPHPPLCGTMEKHLTNESYTLHAHTSLVFSTYFI